MQKRNLVIFSLLTFSVLLIAGCQEIVGTDTISNPTNSKCSSYTGSYGQTACAQDKTCEWDIGLNRCIERIKCIDSDGGTNNYEKGEVTITRSGRGWVDQCSVGNDVVGGCEGVNCVLYEMSCSPGAQQTFDGVYFNIVNCPQGCKDGVCAEWKSSEFTTYPVNIFPNQYFLHRADPSQRIRINNIDKLEDGGTNAIQLTIGRDVSLTPGESFVVNNMKITYKGTFQGDQNYGLGVPNITKGVELELSSV